MAQTYDGDSLDDDDDWLNDPADGPWTAPIPYGKNYPEPEFDYDQDGPLPRDHAAADDTDDDDVDSGATLEGLEQNFWDARDELKLIYAAALSRMTSPWAVLACCAARILCVAPPAVTLPAIIGGAGSLNWFAAITAKSGGGKGAAMAVAARLIRADLTVRGVGSGEGMIETYQRGNPKIKDPPPPVTAVLFSIDEIDSLHAMGGRSGQTTTAIIRQGFSGETLGYSYRGRQAETVTAHTYRMCVVASVQPERAGVLFDDAGGGTPQRFMWFPGRDRRICADPPEWPIGPGGADREIPVLSPRDLTYGTVPIPAETLAELRAARAASMNGADNALDGHALFCREKFAYALALMNAHTDITAEDWRLSGVAASVSDWCRTKAQTAYQGAKQAQSRERGHLKALENDERQLVEHATQVAHIARLAVWVRKTLRERGPLTNRELTQWCASRDRRRLPDALTLARDKGWVFFSEGIWRAM